MSAVDENDDAMTTSFSASTFDSEAHDPWTGTAQGLSPVDLSAILSGMPLPAIYTKAFDLAQPSAGKVTVLAVNKIMGVSGLPPATVDKIMNTVVDPTRSRITKGECSVALALVAMAQKNMDVTIESLTAHREADSPMTGNGGPENMRKEIHQWFLNLDTIRISFAPEKEGVFLFKHTNYIVESKNRQTRVIRRYSDFWWLLEVLGKRFPFRILPNLPPKRLGVADETFLERRLCGLCRFTNALIRHPVLRNDPLVISFLTEPVELALWRKNVVISTEDEFTSQLPISESLSKQVPADLELQLNIIRRRLPASLQYYRSIVHVMDRVQKRTEATAADFMRFSLALNALADCERQCHVEECYNCGQLSQGYSKIGSHLGQTSHLLGEQAKAIQREMVEELKRHRDLLVSVMELLQRHDRSRGAGIIESLQKRVVANEAKLKTAQASAAAAAAAARAEGGGDGSGDYGAYDAQIEKLTNNINSDRAELEVQGQRSVLLQYTLWMEVTYFHKNQALIATMYQDFVREQIKTGQSLNENWKELSPIVHDLPMEVNGFN
ncbi:sorting nexin [Dissophora ornata]|nr:sorting nexin [Dissophora ornata]